MNYDGIIFDLDGTLWDSTKPICDSWNEILEKHPEITRRKITMEDLGDCMGLPMYEIAAKLFSEEDKDTQKTLMDELCGYENEYLAEHGGTLYPQLEEVLGKLKEKYPLFIVSNCQDGYIEAFLKAHHLESYFTDTECWGRTRATKGESNKILMKRNHLQNAIYVGDTAGDAKSAADAQIPFVYAAYGFGNVESSEYRIEQFKDLINLFL